MNQRLVACVFCTCCLTVVLYITFSMDDLPYKFVRIHEHRMEYDSPSAFENFDNVSGTRDGCYIVPNYVHFIRFDMPTFTFVDAVCVLAALKNQQPDKIFIHTNQPNFRGKYWEILISKSNLTKVLEIKYMEMPTQIFGQKLRKIWLPFHGGDVARIRVLMQYGGIFLDNDSYIVKSLNDFRRYEMTLGWKNGGNISNQVIVAHKNARFLHEWLETYKGAYDPKCWFCNAAFIPTRKILMKRPYLIHRVPRFLAEFFGIMETIFQTRSNAWKNHYAIHLLINHQYLLKNVSSIATYPVEFDENNIKNYNIGFKDMVNDVFPLE